MSKWNKDTFVQTTKDNCEPRISNIMVALINFTDSEADQVSWGRGEGYGTMTYKCKSADFGVIPLFHLTTNGQIKFPLNLLRNRVQKKEIISDFQLKLESNFMMYFDEDVQPSDVFFNIDDLFLMRADIDRFIFTIQGIAARLYQ